MAPERAGSGPPEWSVSPRLQCADRSKGAELAHLTHSPARDPTVLTITRLVNLMRCGNGYYGIAVSMQRGQISVHMPWGTRFASSLILHDDKLKPYWLT